MEKTGYTFFVDFDGTIATIDVCEAIVKAFSQEGWQEINEKWEKKELSTLECARQTFKLFKTNAPQDIQSLVNNTIIDPSFSEFAAYCKKRGFPLVILSDGYDYYIEYLLKREGLELPYYANKLLFSPQMDLEAPYSSSSCDSCGVCKLELMQKLMNPSHQIVYIGDGYSDFCPAQSADIVFAKTTLYEHCLKIGKAACYFADFSDILNQIKSITGEKL